jgi:hypothetical protein
MALGDGRFLALHEHGELVPHAGTPELPDAKADRHILRIRDRRVVTAPGFHAKADGIVFGNVETAVGDEYAVHDRVEPCIIHYIIHVAIGVVVAPACGDWKKPYVVGSNAGCLTLLQDSPIHDGLE